MLTLLSQSGNVVSERSTMASYIGLMLKGNVDVLAENFDIDEFLFASLFWAGVYNNFQKCLALQSYRRDLPVQIKIYSHVIPSFGPARFVRRASKLFC